VVLAAVLAALASASASLASGGGVSAPSSATPPPDSSQDYVFPVRGEHTYGDGFGVQRAGHTHQGQDVMAACDTKLVSAGAGKVQARAKHSAAGYYVVIDNKLNGRDFAYMHLKRPAIVQKGDSVRKGQKIGNVGKTGNATACHLHFEIWSSPGYYEGGKPIDPLPKLKKWDSYS
jgi:murein DD-endopeptidase MepM/ murein hydrolase activator NlpD